jgi:hypothetical protein
MVFEGVLTQVLNRFLGAYVENLDTNQLRVGIWGGDVELKDLVLKQSALDDLDLPLQTIYGRVGKLVLKYRGKFVWCCFCHKCGRYLFIGSTKSASQIQ